MTGTIGTAATVCGVGVGGGRVSVGVALGGGGCVVNADADAEGWSRATCEALGPGDADGPPAASPTVIATVTARSATTVTRGSRFTGANCASRTDPMLGPRIARRA